MIKRNGELRLSQFCHSFFVGKIQSKNLHAAEDCFFRSDIPVMYRNILGKTDTVQYLAEFSGDGDAGNRSDGFAVVVICQTDFSADVIVVGVYLKT